MAASVSPYSGNNPELWKVTKGYDGTGNCWRLRVKRVRPRKIVSPFVEHVMNKENKNGK